MVEKNGKILNLKKFKILKKWREKILRFKNNQYREKKK